MATSKLNKERLQTIASWRAKYGTGHNVVLPAEEAEMMASALLVLMAVPDTLPCQVELNPGLIIGKGCKTEILLNALQRRAEYYAELDAMTPEQRAKHDASIAAFKAMLPMKQPELTDLGSPEQQQPPEVMICDMCGHDAWLGDGGWYSCDGGHSFQVRSEPVSQRYKLPPHVYRELVNGLRDVSVKYAGCQQLRAQISKALSTTFTVSPEVK